MLSGHNSYKACRYCDLRGVFNNHVYYPTTPPSNKFKKYDPLNLPKRTHEDYETRIEQVMSNLQLPSKIREKLVSNSGN